MSDTNFVGPTGDFPDGKLSEYDEGLQMAMVADAETRTVQIHFGTPVKWLGMSPADARNLSKMLIEKADEVEKMAEVNNT